MVNFRLEMGRVVASLQFHPYATVEKAFAGLVASDSELQKLVATQGGTSRVMENIYLAFRQGIADSNTDKRYYLTKLRELNAVSAEMAAYIDELVDASRELSSSEYTCRDASDMNSWWPIAVQPPPTLPPPRLIPR